MITNMSLTEMTAWKLYICYKTLLLTYYRDHFYGTILQ